MAAEKLTRKHDNRYAEIELNLDGEDRSPAAIVRLGRLSLMNVLKHANYHETEMQDFADIYTPQKIQADERYVRNCERAFNREEKDELATAKIFEEMFVSGVNFGSWLGNISMDKEQRVQSDFFVEAQSTTKFDDYRHKIDAYATLDFPEPIVDEDYETSTSQVVLGFDVTVNGSRQAILDKITRFYNGKEELPFGFSMLDYYDGDDGHRQLAMLPRYTIGVSDYTVNGIVETASVDEVKNRVNFKLFSGQNLLTRFKVLAEIRAENELYQAMLPDDLDSEMLQQANIQLYAADQCLNQALQVCTAELVHGKCLPPQVLAEVEAAQKTGRGVKARNIVQKYLLERSQEIFDEESKGLRDAESRARSAQGAQSNGDTFVQIIQLCEELKAAAYAGTLDGHRQVGVHSAGLSLEDLAGDAA